MARVGGYCTVAMEGEVLTFASVSVKLETFVESCGKPLPAVTEADGNHIFHIPVTEEGQQAIEEYSGQRTVEAHCAIVVSILVIEGTVQAGKVATGSSCEAIALFDAQEVVNAESNAKIRFDTIELVPAL